MDLENRQETGSGREIVFDNAATAAGRGSGAADDLVSRLSAARLLAILRLEDPETAGVELARRLHSQGIRAIECTLNRSGALAAIERIQEEFGSDTLVGAGTVTRLDQIDSLVSLGVDFCVTPHLDPALVTKALERGLAMIPGVMTPSEVAEAFRLGVPAVKLFPAGVLGVGYLEALQGPFGNFPVVPTGSIDLGDVEGWLRAGALAVGLGSALVRPEVIPPELTALLR